MVHSSWRSSQRLLWNLENPAQLLWKSIHVNDCSGLCNNDTCTYLSLFDDGLAGKQNWKHSNCNLFLVFFQADSRNFAQQMPWRRMQFENSFLRLVFDIILLARYLPDWPTKHGNVLHRIMDFPKSNHLRFKIWSRTTASSSSMHPDRYSSIHV